MRSLIVLAAGSFAALSFSPATAQVPQTYNCGTTGQPACPTSQQRTEAARPAPDTKRYGERPDSGSHQPSVNDSNRSSGKGTSSSASPR